ncbi:MAG: hypothetical protein ITG02_16115 [Patulibacter sp.]|nr:hypothetical protein [Patulibacter sp.]
MRSRMPWLALVASAILALGASSASAGIWTPVESGTVQDITAVDYRGPGQLRYATAGGQILANGVLQHSAPGFSFNDLAFNPSGTIGIAVGSNATLRRSVGGGAWTPILLANTYDHGCTPGGPYPATPITGELTAVAWADDATAYAVGTMEGVVLKTINGGANWVDESRKFNGTCLAGKDRTLHDVETVPGTSQVSFVDTSFGGRWLSTNGLATAATHQANSSVNCPTASNGAPRLAIDPANPSRQHAVARCSGSLNFGVSGDGGATFDLSRTYHFGSGSELTGLRGVDTLGGSTLAVGHGGAILVAPDGENAYFQRADGSDAATDWLSVAKADATRAAVGGRNGRLLVTSAADTIPMLPPPPAPPAPPAPPPPAPPAPPLPPRPTAPTTRPVLPGTRTASPTQTAKVGGGSVTVGGPKTCVRPGKAFTATLKWKRSKKKGSKLVKVTRTDFYIDKKRVKIDRKAPFRQRLTVKKLRPGTTHVLRARAFIKVKRGTGPKKSLRVKFSVCSS